MAVPPRLVLRSYDFDENPMQGFVPETVAVLPQNAAQGRVVRSAVLGCLVERRGATWVPLGGNSYAETITGDGATREFTVTHGLGSTDVTVTVRDPLDRNARVHGVDDLAPTPDTVVIQLAEPLPAAAPLRIIVKR